MMMMMMRRRRREGVKEASRTLAVSFATAAGAGLNGGHWQSS